METTETISETIKTSETFYSELFWHSYKRICNLWLNKAVTSVLINFSCSKLLQLFRRNYFSPLISNFAIRSCTL
jgi:hypothetical protein